MNRLKTLIFLCLVLLFASPLTAQTDFWLRTCDTLDNCGYKDQDGKIRIEQGKYPRCFTDTLFRFAIVYKPDSGLVAIDRNEKILFHVWVVDNGPDYPSEGLFRIVKNGKIGFANLNGEIVIPPRFDAVYPFQDGMAAFCAGCRTEHDKVLPEHNVWTGGLWGFINKKGEMVADPVYQKIWNAERKEYQFKKDENMFTIKNGKLIKIQ